MGLRRRLARLEARAKGLELRRDVSEEVLRSLPDGDLDALTDEVEAAVARGERGFWDLFAVTQERSRRAIARLFDAIEDERAGREPPAGEVFDEDEGALGLLVGIEAGDEEARRNWERRNGYRIWRYWRKEHER